MTEHPLIARQRNLLHDLFRVADERGRIELTLGEDLRSRMEAVETECGQAVQALQERLAAEGAAADSAAEEARRAIEERFEADKSAAVQELNEARLGILARYRQERDKARAAYQEARWTIAALLEGKKNTAQTQLHEQTGRVEAKRARLQEIRQEARKLLEEWKQPTAYLDGTPPAGSAAPQRRLPQCVADARDLLVELRELVVPRFLKGRRLPLLFVFLWLALAYPLGLAVARLAGPSAGLPVILVVGLVASTAVAAAGGSLTHAILSALARRQVQRLAEPLGETLAEAETRARQLLARLAGQCSRQVLVGKKRHNRDLRQAHGKYRVQAEGARQRKAQALPGVKERYQARYRDAVKHRAEALRQVDQRHAQARAATRQRQAERADIEGRRRRLLEGLRAEYERDWGLMAEGWRHGLAEARRAVSDINESVGRLFPAWDDPGWREWTPATTPPPVLRFGTYRVARERVPHAVPADDRLKGEALTDFTLPALYPFPARSLLLHARDEGREHGVQLLQALLFRLLTAIQPGKVRLTIIDPVRLGQDFAGFMHLADYDEALVGSRIWTEVAHIERALIDLTAHMENVIQKYLRDRYPTIADYNAEAGEVAEPYRVVVVNDFPAHFSEEACRRLVSIAQSGPRCGVTTLVGVDSKQPLPKGFDLKDLERVSANLTWEAGRFAWRDEDFGPFPLELERSPEPGLAHLLLERVGEQARDARRVEVPFDFIAPAAERWWTGDSRAGLDVALGRSGATRRQHLQLGRGTAQHVLVAGKTGSGKSTLLHALIVNLALTYSPDELELYLIDFKKGVEFKTYAVHELPHARVVAIESEREFGLSVLQALDAQLKVRGERFREAGAQDLASYRQAGLTMPRLLLVVDEFQEFFVEDDRIAQDGAQLLDRLVRQGRAFGLHVLLGSQTLGGAYSLARSTIDQMAVRIALQCSEADAQLILSADNSAARLLSRPGEAIYNDANGLIEGNHPFQVVWLPDQQREQYLRRVRGQASERGWPHAPTVFEGNAPADVTKNLPLNEALRTPALSGEGGKEEHRVRRAWLGEAMALTDQTAALFRRRNGCNLLIVGQQDRSALGMLATALVSLAAQTPPAAGEQSRPSFYLLDGNQAGPPEEGLLARLANALAGRIHPAGWRETPAVLAELAGEVERRQKDSGAESPALYLVLNGLQRFRDLRRQEDDFGLGRRGDEPLTPSQHLANLLREGSALGVHTLVWCDTLTNLQRALDRQALRELALRVVLQMSVADSSHLIDSPLAAKLGQHRALFVSEEDGRLEKFRPYGLPPDEWLDWVKRQLESLTQLQGSPSP